MPSGYRKDGSFSGIVFKKGDIPWRKGKNKKDFPQLSNSGRRRIHKKLNRKCPICNKRFETTTNYNRIFCSKKCYTIDQKSRKPWNAGLTAKTDIRVRLNGLKVSQALQRPETKALMKKSMKGRKSWSKGLTKETDERVRRMAEATSRGRLKVVIPKKDTKIERIFQEALSHVGVKFKTHVPLKGQPDIFISPSLCVFLDGCYWHCCPTCDIPHKNKSKQRKKDGKINNILREAGYDVIRFWEHEILADVDGCIEKILRFGNAEQYNNENLVVLRGGVVDNFKSEFDKVWSLSEG